MAFASVHVSELTVIPFDSRELWSRFQPNRGLTRFGPVLMSMKQTRVNQIGNLGMQDEDYRSTLRKIGMGTRQR